MFGEFVPEPEGISSSMTVGITTQSMSFGAEDGRDLIMYG